MVAPKKTRQAGQAPEAPGLLDAGRPTQARPRPAECPKRPASARPQPGLRQIKAGHVPEPAGLSPARPARHAMQILARPCPGLSPAWTRPARQISAEPLDLAKALVSLTVLIMLWVTNMARTYPSVQLQSC